ncbi:hypothetical protein NMD1_03819 [Novosphingobium sp. MD-1]|nr:hypothetical protein NMD1_03819 [Novosphingobium sp. MD-1]
MHPGNTVPIRQKRASANNAECARIALGSAVPPYDIAIIGADTPFAPKARGIRPFPPCGDASLTVTR